jgi:NADPH:quinone reductase-like Zn-dependent oxidoreductase
VRREEAAEQVRQFGGDRVVIQGDNLHKDIEEALDGKKLSLVLDTVGGTPVGELAKSLKNGGSIVVYALQGGEFPVFSPGDSRRSTPCSTSEIMWRLNLMGTKDLCQTDTLDRGFTLGARAD